MPRATQTDLAVLAALSVAPMTGYALREAIISDLGSFWTESFGQIYPALDRLTARGFIATQPGSRRGSQLYRLTAPGEAHLLALMQAAPTNVPPRDGLLLRLFFGKTLGPTACRELVLHARERAHEQLASLAAIRAADAEEPATADSPYWQITISAGEHRARSTITWADETLVVLDQLAKVAIDRNGQPGRSRARIGESQGTDEAITSELSEERSESSH